jgi:ABC-type transport system involved in cytochrome c biogenesis permease component
VIGAALAWALVSRPSDRRVALLAGLFCFGQIVTWALFVTVPVPGFAGTPEPVEAIALVSKAAELLGVLLVLPLAIPHRIGRLSVSAA